MRGNPTNSLTHPFFRKFRGFTGLRWKSLITQREKRAPFSPFVQGRTRGSVAFYGIGPGSDRGGHLFTHLSRVVIVPGQPGQGAMSNDHFDRQTQTGITPPFNSKGAYAVSNQLTC